MTAVSIAAMPLRRRFRPRRWRLGEADSERSRGEVANMIVVELGFPDHYNSTFGTLVFLRREIAFLRQNGPLAIESHTKTFRL